MNAGAESKCWDKYVAPFIKNPGRIAEDPVAAAIHLTNVRWMRALGRGHHSRTDAAWHVNRYTWRVLKEDRRRILGILKRAKVLNAGLERAIMEGSGR